MRCGHTPTPVTNSGSLYSLPRTWHFNNIDSTCPAFNGIRLPFLQLTCVYNIRFRSSSCHVCGAILLTRKQECSQGDPVICYPPIQFRFCRMAVDPHLTSWPRYQVSTLYCFFVSIITTRWIRVLSDKLINHSHGIENFRRLWNQ
jgi:hypothetical protein